ncbi:MAG: histidine kinase [Myxococcales bacterium]|nr:histidine kinase [Myxococcales bacterium]
MSEPRGLLADTLAALGAPRRLIPILLVSTPLVAAQHSLSRDALALPLGVLMCVTFVLVAPYLWRRLRPVGDDPRRWLGLVIYGGAGLLLVGFLGIVVPKALGVGATFLTGRESMAVSLALFWVGGWGLGRDVELERRFERERERADGLAREAERAQLLALRSHLDPHFLFNTLNAIAEWCREDGAVAEAAILRLSTMLRTILAGVQLASWPLRRELELCGDLFELHRIRDPSRFTSTIAVDGEVGDFALPPMLLLPAVENAIKHGPAAGHGGEVRVEVALAGEGCTVTIRNPGRFTGRRPGGEGVPTIERRLALAYGGGASLTLEADGDATVTTIVLPARAPIEAV